VGPAWRASRPGCVASRAAGAVARLPAGVGLHQAP
jgi:hypothetical protein